MKKIIVILVMLCFLTAFGWSQEEAPDPSAGLSILFTDSFAFFGIGGELFLGNLGIGITFTTMFLGGENWYLFFYEPGAYVHYYFFGPAASIYLGVGATYFSLIGEITGSGLDVQGGLLNLNGAIGFNAMFGSKKEFRFGIELGPRYVIPTQTTSTGLIIPHFMFQFGMTI